MHHHSYSYSYAVDTWASGVIEYLRQTRRSLRISNEEEEARCEATKIAEAVTNRMISLDENKLEQIGLNTIKQIRWQLFRLYLRLSDKDPLLMFSFFIWWEAFILKFVTSQNLPIKLFCWDEIVNVVNDSHILDLKPPRGYIVSGAGSEFINGRYDFVPNAKIMENGRLEQSSAPFYRRAMPTDELADGEGGGKTLTLFKCHVRSLDLKWWFLSEADAQQPGTERDTDYYQHKSKTNEDELPPPSGWITMDAGADPPPTLEPLSLKLPGDEEHNLENQLTKWAIENGILDLVFAEPISSEIVAKSTELVKFLAERICVSDGTNEGAMALEQFCCKAWKTCSETTDAELSAQICQLLVSVVPLLSDALTISLFQTIHNSLVRSNKLGNDSVSGFCRNIDVLTESIVRTTWHLLSWHGKSKRWWLRPR